MNKKTIKTFAAIMVAGAIIAAPLAASAYPAGDVFHVDQTDTSVAKGERLRSHGGTSEARVPFVLSAPLNATYQAKAQAGLHSFQIFDFAINGTR